MKEYQGLSAAGEIRSSAFDAIALVLQGGGALGSYQAGVYEALAKAGLHPDWVAGISIGAVNCALIAGNPPEKRVEKLQEFWETIGNPPLGPFGVYYNASVKQIDDNAHRTLNQVRGLGNVAFGAPGFFEPRFPSPWILPSKKPDQLSLYDVSPLKRTLGRLVDFDLINSGPTRLSVGAVNVGTGNLKYFDTTTDRIDFRHIMASGSLPPGFPATEIDGDYFWDGGLVSNTPLQWVLDARPRRDTLALQVDLWDASGPLPGNLNDAEVRQKDIQFSSRTRDATDQIVNAQRMRRAFRRLHDQLPETLRDSPDARLLAGGADDAVCNVVHLTYNSKAYEGSVKDYEFSRRAIEAHWRAGFDAATRALSHPEILLRPDNPEGFRVFDFSRDA